ncbi:MAG: type II toxin-antitoxin system PemK/MazF family toxin [Candidatus Kapabacteria bacterium]|nr:type II toxin-antitoxin system PemK/MazF family toxin [Candidatus Kapabacteria bacterium]
MNFSQNQIWLINFDPSFGHEYQKMRPGIIIENNFYMPRFDLLTIVPISSNILHLFELDIFFPKTQSNRLLNDSIIKTKQINSFDKKRFIKYIGLFENEIFLEIQKNISIFLD